MATQAITATTFEQTIDAKGIVLLDFWATWCPPCRAFGPVFERSSEQHPEMVFGKVDTDHEQELGSALEIMSIPTLMVFRDGILLYREAGAIGLKQLESLIEQVQALDMDDVRRQVAAQSARASSDAADSNSASEPEPGGAVNSPAGA